MKNIRFIEKKINEYIQRFGDMSEETKEEFIEAIIDDYSDSDVKQITMQDMVEIWGAMGFLHLEEELNNV
jgi:t-SNARE complex subunit (syntaxin)